MKLVLYGLAGLVLYEVLRENVAKSVRRNVPIVFEAELRGRSEYAGLLGPLLGTPAVALAIGAVAEQTVLDQLPTVVGRKRYTPLATRV
jgi:hypothetical protein